MAKTSSPVVAIINTNDDLVSILSSHLQSEGFTVVAAHIRDIRAGKTDVVAFLRLHEPEVVIYDIAVPYEENWVLFQTLRQLPAFADRSIVLTTFNKRIFQERVGAQDIVEIQGGRAQDFEPVVEAVHTARRGATPAPPRPDPQRAVRRPERKTKRKTR